MMTQSTPYQRPRGAALMAVIWLIAVLAMACMATLRVISFDMEISSAKIHGSRARQVAEMGIAIGSHNLVKRTDPLLHRMDEETGEGFDVTITSEGSRFNINWILASEDKNLLRDIFIKWGLELDTAQSVADAFKDWYDPDDNEELKGAEKKYYEKEGRINQPFNRAFYDVNEMALVRGMDLVEAVKPDWREWFTVLSSGGLDVRDASAELLAAAADTSVEEADGVPEKVRGTDGIRDTTDDYEMPLEEALGLLGVDSEDPVISKRFSAGDATTRIESIGTAEGTKRKITVILANRTGGRPLLLERTEEIIP